jgi:hypothetical protein
MSQPIHINDRGAAVDAYQRHLNDRLHAHHLDPSDVDGVCGPQTIERSAQAAFFLGALDATIRTVQSGTIPVGVQTIVADPGSRDPAQRRRAIERRGKPLPGGNGAPAGSFRIVPTAEWGAAPARHPTTRAGRPHKIIFHHTEGHHPELDHVPGDSLDEAKAFARQIQQGHFERGFSDSGHNFLVTRSGHILEGRHGSIAAIDDGVMVVSAHTVGQNGQPGIEHEHIGPEAMTAVQREASLSLHEHICRRTGIDPSQIHGHKEFNNTDCPGVLFADIDGFRKALAKRLGQ